MVLQPRQEEHFVQDEDVGTVDCGITAIQRQVLNVRKAALARSTVGRIFFDVGNRVRPSVRRLQRGHFAELGAEQHLQRVIAGMTVAAEEVDRAEVAGRTNRIDAGCNVGAPTRAECSTRRANSSNGPRRTTRERRSKQRPPAETLR